MNAPADDPERERSDAMALEVRVRAEQIGYVHDRGAAGASAMLAVGLLYGAALWPITDHAHLLGWFGLLALVCAARLGFALHWRRNAAARTTGFWARAAVAINLLAGAAWGYAAVALFPLNHPDRYLLAAFVLVGMPAAALTSLGAWAPAYVAYALAAIAPFVLWMFAQGAPQYLLVGLAGSVFCAYLLRQAQAASATIRRNTAQRIELEQMAQRLAQARDAADSANRAKSAFLASISHELRTPLNAVVGLSDLLVDTPSEPRGRELARTMRQSALSLLAVIDRVLDMGRIEAGRVELRPRSFEVRALMRDVHAMFAREAHSRGLALGVDVDGAVPALITGDPDRIRQVLVNLIDNALKFTPAGSVGVKVTAGTRADNRYLLRFEVADSGPGVPEPIRARLFGAPARDVSLLPGAQQGASLGLGISAALVRLMGGEIDCRNEPGGGATVWFTCVIGIGPPTIAREIALDAPPTVRRAVSPRVLVIEDNSVNLMLTRKMLESFGCDVRSAASGAEGLERMQHEPFDLVFMDVSMPGMDGIETTRVWRAHESSGEHRLPIVALTANAMEGDRQACLAAGMDDYLAKPVTLGALQRMVARHVPGVPV